MNISPIVVPSPNLNSNLIADPSIKRALERALHCDVILQSFSPVDTSAPPYLDSHLKEDDLNHLRTEYNFEEEFLNLIDQFCLKVIL